MNPFRKTILNLSLHTLLRVFAKKGVPHLEAIFLYAGWFLKNSISDFNASSIGLLLVISCWLRFTTPMNPNFNGKTRPVRISSALVPASIRSNLVSTPIVLLPILGERKRLIWTNITRNYKILSCSNLPDLLASPILNFLNWPNPH